MLHWREQLESILQTPHPHTGAHMREWKPQVGDLLECITYGDRHIVIGCCTFTQYHQSHKGFELLNVQTGEVEKHRQDRDWWNWYTQERT